MYVLQNVNCNADSNSLKKVLTLTSAAVEGEKVSLYDDVNRD